MLCFWMNDDEWIPCNWSVSGEQGCNHGGCLAWLPVWQVNDQTCWMMMSWPSLARSRTTSKSLRSLSLAHSRTTRKSLRSLSFSSAEPDHQLSTPIACQSAVMTVSQAHDCQPGTSKTFKDMAFIPHREWGGLIRKRKAPSSYDLTSDDHFQSISQRNQEWRRRASPQWRKS